ncbi:MAG TPA: GAF domain-containing protein [Syntrophobacteraceae bacterium]|nr:GAF domain-containing protein [Syntrophobacteraceae bacterium]
MAVYGVNEFVLDSLPHPVMLIDRKRVVLAANQAAREMGAVVGEPCWRHFAGKEDRAEDPEPGATESRESLSGEGYICRFCLADQAIKENRATQLCQFPLCDRLWNLWWIPVGQSVFLVYAIDVSEEGRARKELEEALHQTTRLQREIMALLAGSKAVLEYRTFEETARALFRICKELLGAGSGYVSLVNERTMCAEVAFLDPGGKECTASEDLPMPIRGLRLRACASRKAIYDNDFSRSEYSLLLPPGHMPLENVLFAPLILREKTVGLLGLADKPGGFNERDVQLASAFGELAAVALVKKRSEEELLRAHQDLEARVAERTAELERANATLRMEIEQRRKAEAALLRSEQQLKFLSSRLLAAQEEERTRLAREIHDQSGQTLAAIKFGIEGAIRMALNDRKGDLIQHLEKLLPTIRAGIAEVRGLYMSLRPTLLDDLGLTAALGWLCREFTKVYPDIAIAKTFPIDENLVPQSLKIVVFRIVQEALNNIVRHSTATTVELGLKEEEDRIHLLIRDNGLGFNLSRTLSSARMRGLGLASMRELSQLSGGTFSIDSVTGSGTTIHASWPCRRNDPDPDSTFSPTRHDCAEILP